MRSRLFGNTFMTPLSILLCDHDCSVDFISIEQKIGSLNRISLVRSGKRHKYMMCYWTRRVFHIQEGKIPRINYWENITKVSTYEICTRCEFWNKLASSSILFTLSRYVAFRYTYCFTGFSFHVVLLYFIYTVSLETAI